MCSTPHSLLNLIKPLKLLRWIRRGVRLGPRSGWPSQWVPPNSRPILGRAKRNTLELGDVKVVDMQPEYKLCPQFPNEILWYLPIIAGRFIKHHKPPLHPILFPWIVLAPVHAHSSLHDGGWLVCS